MSRMIEALKQLEEKRPPEMPAVDRGEVEDRDTGDDRGEADVAARQSDLEHADPKTVWMSPPPEEPAEDSKAAPAWPAGDESPPLSPAERAGLADLESEPLRRQYTQWIDNIVAHGGFEESTAVALVGLDDRSDTSGALVRLALLLAEWDGPEVLLVDGNLADRTLTKGFHRDGATGLADIAAGRSTWRETILPTATPRLRLLPGGHAVVPEGVSMVGTLAPIFTEMKRRRAIVLVDAGKAGSPPAESLAQACDAVCVAVRLGRTRCDAAAEAMAQLQSAGAGVLGCVVTGAPREDQ